MTISAKIVADSISEDGNRITTFELNYPRFIHGELMTHRLFSRNAMSSRAVPISKMIEQVRNDPAMPVHWGKNQAGMQAKGECDDPVIIDEWSEYDTPCDLHLFECTSMSVTREDAWKEAAWQAAYIAKAMSDSGYHKQIVNRLLEPFQWMKTVVTATEFDNFFYLRCHEDAQPEIKVLAEKMWEEYNKSAPMLLKSGEWHVPYVYTTKVSSGEVYYSVMREGDLDERVSLEEALKVSASCCAQVSYRVLDNGLDKAKMIYDRLVESKPVHASPFEHQATPIGFDEFELGSDGEPLLFDMPEGVTHMDRGGSMWSGNLKGWIQHRQLIKDNVCWDYKEEPNE